MAVFDQLKQTTVYFSKSIGAPIYNCQGNMVGKLKDFFVDYEDIYPAVLGVQYKKGNRTYYYEWQDIKSFSYKKIILEEKAQPRSGRSFPKVFSNKPPTGKLAEQFLGKTTDYPPIGKIVLDRQIVDTAGKKVVRVNDIHFIRIGQQLRVTHAAVGLRSMLRRLGYDVILDPLVKLIKPKASYFSNEALINWKYVHAVPDKNIQPNVQLSLANEEIQSLHPADLADILEELDHYGRKQLFSNLPPEAAAEILSEVDQEIQASLIEDETPMGVAEILQKMGTDEAADLLGDLPEKQANLIISQIKDGEFQEEIQELLEYEEDTAGGIMSSEVLRVIPSDNRESIIKMIQQNHEEFESIYDIFVTDENEKLIGTCSLKELLISDSSMAISEIMEQEDIKALSSEASWREIAQYMSKYNLINVPIIDEEHKLLGLISVDDILPWLLKERQ